MRDDRLERVQLELPRLGGHGHRHVGARDGERDLIDDLGDDGVHLAGHDAGAGLHRGGG